MNTLLRGCIQVTKQCSAERKQLKLHTDPEGYELHAEAVQPATDLIIQANGTITLPEIPQYWTVLAQHLWMLVTTSAGSN